MKAKAKGSAEHSDSGPSEQTSTTSRQFKPYRILLADDHPVVRRGLRAILETQRDIEVCGEAADGGEPVDLTKKAKPDLVLLDLTMPEMSGLEVTTAVRECSPETDVLVLSMHFSEELAREVLRCGALGYMLKSDADSELLEAIDRVRRRQPFFTSKLASAMAQNFMDGTPEAGVDEKGKPASPLTDREVQVVQLD